MEDRKHMTEHLNAVDYNLDFVVSFLGPNYHTVPLDSRIGILMFGVFQEAGKLEN